MSFVYSLCSSSERGILEPTIDLLPTYDGFILILVEQHTGIPEVMDSNPVMAFSFWWLKKLTP